jgi:hypothetical protein
MKIKRQLIYLVIVLFGSYAARAQNPTHAINDFNLGPRVHESECGLDYKVQSVAVNQRVNNGTIGMDQTSTNPLGNPATDAHFTIAVPSGGNNILNEAHIWFTIVGQGPVVPIDYPFMLDGLSFKAKLVGEFFDGPDIYGATCWVADYKTTATYHAVVTGVFTANPTGPYYISGLPVLPTNTNIMGSNPDTDGATLLLTFHDTTDYNLNSLTVWDGAAFVAGSTSRTFNLNGPAANFALGTWSDRGFAIVGDAELTNLFGSVAFPAQGSSVQLIAGNLWDQVENNAMNFSLNQTVYPFTIQSNPGGSDCLMGAVCGIFNKGDNTTNCIVPLTAYASGDNVLCPNTCTNITIHPSGGTAPYTYDLYEAGNLTTSIGPISGNATFNICPSSGVSYLVKVTDAFGAQVTVNIPISIIAPFYLNQGSILGYTQAGPPNPNFCEGWGPTIVMTLDPQITYPYAVAYTWTYPDGSTSTTATSTPISVPNTPASNGQYCLQIQDSNGCFSNNACFNVNVIPAPTFDDIYMCEGDDPILLGFTSGQSNPNPSFSDYVSLPGGVFSDPNGGVGTLNVGGVFYFFNPANATGTSPYPVTYTYTNGGCTFNVTANIYVSSGAGWPKTTSSANGGDRGTDVDSDSEGNIYVVGDVVQGTTFDNVPITVGGANQGMFLTKYDACGDVQWVAHTWDSETIRNNGVIVDEANDRVYVTGSYDRNFQLRFESAIGQTCSSPPMYANTGSTMYIASYTLDGCLVNVEDYVNAAGDYFVGAIGYGDHGVYVTGRVSANGDSKVFVNRVDKVTLAQDWSMLSTSTVASMSNIGNDLAVSTDPTLGWDNIYVVGNFRSSMTFGSNPISNNNAFMDMFFARIVDNNSGTPILSWINKLDAGSSAAGYSVSLDDNGIPYYTGHFLGTMSIFDGNTYSSIAPQGDAFVMRYDAFSPAGLGAWFRQMNVTGGGYMVGTGISVDQSGVFSTGYYRGASINFASGAIPAATNAFHTFVTKHDFTGNNIWGNATTDNGRHRGLGIKANNSGYCYTVGTYKGNMDFYSGSSSALVSTPGLFNAFVVRNSDATSGDFKRVMSDNTQDQTLDAEISLMPNPNNGHFTVEIKGEQMSEANSVEVYDVMGKKILSTQMVDQTKVDLDISDQATGVYILKIKIGEEVFTERIIKQ